MRSRPNTIYVKGVQIAVSDYNGWIEASQVFHTEDGKRWRWAAGTPEIACSSRDGWWVLCGSAELIVTAVSWRSKDLGDPAYFTLRVSEAPQLGIDLCAPRPTPGCMALVQAVHVAGTERFELDLNDDRLYLGAPVVLTLHGYAKRPIS